MTRIDTDIFLTANYANLRESFKDIVRRNDSEDGNRRGNGKPQMARIGTTDDADGHRCFFNRELCEFTRMA